MRRITMTLLLLVGMVPCAFASSDIEADRTEARIDKEYSPEPAGNPYINAIVTKLAGTSAEIAALNLRPKVVKGSMPVVFVLNNGALFVSTGLLARMQNDSQVASLLASEIAGRYLATQPQYQNKPPSARSAFGKILLVTVTAGLAVYPLMKSEEKAQDAETAAFNYESDKLGLKWVNAAGWDASQGEAAVQRLLEALAEEDRFGGTQLASKALLTERKAVIAKAALEIQQPTLRAESVSTPVSLAQLARRFALQIAQDDMQKSNYPEARAMLDRLDREGQATLETDCIRARMVRNSAVGSEVSDETIAAYQKCVAWPKVNPLLLKELGFLYQSRGDASAAKAAYEKYLLADPTAVDAPIVRGYITELSK